jgi:hypothetical protein
MSDSKRYYIIELWDTANPGCKLRLYAAPGTTREEAWKVVHVARRHRQSACVLVRDVPPEHGGHTVESLLEAVRM